MLAIGILGTARIARGFAKSVRGGEATARVVAVASRDAARAHAFAREFELDRAHGSYEALLADPGVDAVYVPLPNSMHAEWAMRAARAGKHVLCEKPLATSAADARAMFACAAEHGVQLLEAYPYRFQPQTLALRALAHDGVLGVLRLIRASFAFPLDAHATGVHDIRLDPALGGGALWDVGCYPVSLVRMLAGRRARRAFAFARWSDGGAVDTTLAGTLDFDGDLIAQIACSFGTTMHRHALVAGADGVAECGFYNHPPEGGATITLRRGHAPGYASETVALPARDGFVVEAAAFAALVATGAPGDSGMTADESIDTLAMIEALLASARTGAVVEIPAE